MDQSKSLKIKMGAILYGSCGRGDENGGQIVYEG
jgi:hypothetical protein